MPTLYRNGVLYAAGRPPGHPATSLLVAGEQVVWVGDDAMPGVRPRRDVAVVDLQGALVTPAFVDAHVHCTATGLALTGLDLRGRAAAARTSSVRSQRATRAAGGGRSSAAGGTRPSGPNDRRARLRRELDRASYGGVVYLARVDVHSALASSALLAAVPGPAQR